MAWSVVEKVTKGETLSGKLKVDNGLYYGQGIKTNKKYFDHSRVTLSLGYKFNY